MKMLLCEIQVKEEGKKTGDSRCSDVLVSVNCYSAFSVVGGVSSKNNKSNIFHYNMFSSFNALFLAVSWAWYTTSYFV